MNNHFRNEEEPRYNPFTGFANELNERNEDEGKREFAREPMQTAMDDTNWGLFNVRGYDGIMARGAREKDPLPLYDKLWYEGELACLFAESNVGKSILATDIARHIAGDLKKQVLYFDFEHDEKQLQMRYTTADGKKAHWPPMMMRVSFDPAKKRFATTDLLIKNIDEMARMWGCRVMIIDNLSVLSRSLVNGTDASDLMSKLIDLKFKYGLSLLVVAHTPKRKVWAPLSAMDLAGSMRLFNGFDSVFAMGRNRHDDNVRYIKQLKCRRDRFVYGENSVLTCSMIEEPDGYKHFGLESTATEGSQLRPVSSLDGEELKAAVLELREKGKTIMQIRDALGVTYYCAQKIVFEDIKRKRMGENDCSEQE